MITFKRSLIFIFFVTTYFNGFGQEKNEAINNPIPQSPGEIVLLDSGTYLYKAGRWYISGQPNDSILIALKKQNLQLIINIRTPEEIETIKESGFDEVAAIDSLNIAYVNIPIGGKTGYSPETIEDINTIVLQHEGDVMIHCRSATRATLAWMALLINHYQVPVDDAIALGKQIKFQFKLEDFLGYELSFDKK